MENLGLPVFSSGEAPTAKSSVVLGESDFAVESAISADDIPQTEGSGKQIWGKGEEYPPSCSVKVFSLFHQNWWGIFSD